MLEIGSLVDGKYRILRVVGKGGMSVVYQAVNEKANKIWAIKEVRKDGVQNYEVVKQNLIVETELLKRFNHPNLPSIIDVIDGDGTFLIVMDYIEGNSLSKALETSGAQSQEDVIEWSKQLCDVLGYLHSRKPPIIYRDMKPANVMLKPDGNVSLIDFGTAREFKSSSVEDTTCLGTQGYAAPEQYGGHGQTDARTDIYCLGATMYHLVTGHNPSTPPYEMYPIRQWNPMLSSGLEEIIIKCTQRNPEDRYQSCAELLYALDHYQDLDIENKKVQKLKWKVFLTSVILTIVMLFGTIGLNIAKSATIANTYESLIDQADTLAASDLMTEDEIKRVEDKYLEAINKVDSKKIDAYTHLLKFYMSDSRLSEKEYRVIRELLSTHKDELKSGDEAAFINELIAPFADYVFFAYGTKSNVASTTVINASNWYDMILKSDYASESNKKKADILYKVSSNYNDIGKIDLVQGNAQMSIPDYWELLKQLADDNMFADTNLLVKTKAYCFVASELYTKNDRFRNFRAQISEDDYIALLKTLKENILDLKESEEYKINTDFSIDNQDGTNILETLVDNALINIDNSLSAGYGTDHSAKGAGN